MPDFIYDLGLLLIVSARVLSIAKRFDITGVTVVPARLVDRQGRVVHECHWFNIQKSAELLERQASLFELSENGVFRRIQKFVVNPEAVPSDDLFLCDEVAMPVFSQPLVDALLEAGASGATFRPLDGMTWP